MREVCMIEEGKDGKIGLTGDGDEQRIGNEVKQ
jgi:hypothetical protein